MDKTTTASCAVKNLRIYGNGFTCSRAVSVAGANAAIEHVLVQQLNCTLTCFAWTGASNGTVLIDCKARNVTGGNAAFAGSEKHALIRCTVDNITGNAYDGTGGDACVMVGCDFEGAVVNLEGQAVLVGNKFEAVTDIGSANVIAGNKITNITLSGQLAVVHGNKISGVMTITATGDTNSVLANYFGFTGVGGTAVTVQSGATDNTIVGNVFRGYATAISDSGTNTSTDYSGGAAGDNVVY